MLSDRAQAKAELADKNVGPTGKKNDAPGVATAALDSALTFGYT